MPLATRTGRNEMISTQLRGNLRETESSAEHAKPRHQQDGSQAEALADNRLADAFDLMVRLDSIPRSTRQDCSSDLLLGERLARIPLAARRLEFPRSPAADPRCWGAVSERSRAGPGPLDYFAGARVSDL